MTTTRGWPALAKSNLGCDDDEGVTRLGKVGQDRSHAKELWVIHHDLGNQGMAARIVRCIVDKSRRSCRETDPLPPSLPPTGCMTDLKAALFVEPVVAAYPIDVRRDTRNNGNVIGVGKSWYCGVNKSCCSGSHTTRQNACTTDQCRS